MTTNYQKFFTQTGRLMKGSRLCPYSPWFLSQLGQSSKLVGARCSKNSKFKVSKTLPSLPYEGRSRAGAGSRFQVQVLPTDSHRFKRFFWTVYDRFRSVISVSSVWTTTQIGTNGHKLSKILFAQAGRLMKGSRFKVQRSRGVGIVYTPTLPHSYTPKKLLTSHFSLVT